MPRLTEQQHRDRSTYLGATDIAVIAGVNPYKQPFELYLEKIGELDPYLAASKSDLDRWERGHRLEDVALDWHAEITGNSIERVRRDVVHPRLPFIVVHPDARLKPWRTSRTLIEAKTSGRRWDVVPQHVEAQAQMQMAATGADLVIVVVLGFEGPPVPLDVPRNDELIAALEDLARSFWDRVQRHDPPPLDGSRATSRWLDRMFREGPEDRADANQADAIARLLAIRDQMKILEAEDGELVNALKFSMAGGSRMYAPGIGRVLWTAPSSRSTVAWKDVAYDLRRAIDNLIAVGGSAAETALASVLGTTDLAEVEAIHTTVAEGIRQFRVSPAKPAQEEAA